MSFLRRCVYLLVQALAVFLVFLNPSIALAQTSAKSSTVSLLVVGDMMLAGAPGRAMQQGQDPFLGFAKLFKESDIRIGNL